jgi:hypothetical protein
MSASNLGVGASVTLEQVNRGTEAFLGDSSTTTGTNSAKPTGTRSVPRWR